MVNVLNFDNLIKLLFILNICVKMALFTFCEITLCNLKKYFVKRNATVGWGIIFFLNLSHILKRYNLFTLSSCMNKQNEISYGCHNNTLQGKIMSMFLNESNIRVAYLRWL